MIKGVEVKNGNIRIFADVIEEILGCRCAALSGANIANEVSVGAPQAGGRAGAQTEPTHAYASYPPLILTLRSLAGRRRQIQRNDNRVPPRRPRHGRTLPPRL